MCARVCHDMIVGFGFFVDFSSFRLGQFLLHHLSCQMVDGPRGTVQFITITVDDLLADLPTNR